MIVRNYADFIAALRESGFSMSMGSAHGIYTVIPCNWNEPAPEGSEIAWHTGKPDSDPWEWRMRVVEKERDVAYAKCFFGTGGFITKAWAADFYAVRRRGEDFEQAYERGTISQTAKRIYEVVTAMGEAPYHDIKSRGGFRKDENGKFERAIVELQMKNFITICGRARRINKYGEPYGWSSTVFSTVEDFWRARGIDDMPYIDPDAAFDRIRAQILRLNPTAAEKDIRKFVLG